MKISQIVNKLSSRDTNKSYEKLDRFRKMYHSYDIDPHSSVNSDDKDAKMVGKNYRSDAVGVMLPGRLMIDPTNDPSQSISSNKNTGFSGRGPGRFSGKWEELPSLFNPRQKYRGEELITKFKHQAQNPDSRQHKSDNVYTAIRITYKDVPQVAITTTNNVIIKINVGKTARASNISIDQLPKKLRQSEIYHELIKSIENYGYTVTQAKNGDLTITPKSEDVDEILIEFWQIVNIVEDMGEEFTISRDERSSASDIGKTKSSGRANMDYYIGAAEIIQIAHRRGMLHLKSRGGKEDSKGTFDINDSLVSKAFSRKGYSLLQYARSFRKAGEPIPERGKPYREHAVPCALIFDIGLKMYRDKKSVSEVADMIRRNLIIVYISHTEAKKIDDDLKLKTKMPSGWQDGDDPFARFTEAKIKVYRLSDGKRLAETI